MKYIAPISLYCSIGLFLVSLGLPAFSNGREEFLGAFCLFFGWLGLLFVLSDAMVVSWFANPLLLLAWITSIVAWFVFLSNSPRGGAAVVVWVKLSLAFSALAVVFSASFILFKGVEFNFHGGMDTIHRLPGYWLWLSSTIVMFAGNWIALAFTDLTGKKSAMNQIAHSDQTIHSDQAAHSDQTAHSNRTIQFNVKFNRL